ncbi:hypothetical protein A9Q87_03535 [Flavobacteriales bacterium 34_180_T64]|nr:hypothetical protein A9Q87_03535 [Flavobacteriales bacterium 34_180_T64]
MLALKTPQDILDASLKSELYQKLIQQLNKDFRFANIYFEVEVDVSPQVLITQLHETVFRLIQINFTDYLNLLYIIDVSEKLIKELDGSDALKLSEQVVFLILKREWQKVWFKNQFS